MPRAGELTYFTDIGEEGRRHSIDKPFSESPRLFMDLAVVYSLLPPPPARVLECGCGTGWMTYFLARKGYDCLGIDVSIEAIELAKANPVFVQTGKAQFAASDYETMDLHNEFDAVVFYASLHHAQDEQLAIDKAYNALRDNGILIAVEPGCGHTRQARTIVEVETYDVGDRDMPPYRVVRCGVRSGFRRHRIYQHAGQILSVLYNEVPNGKLRRLLFGIPPVKYGAFLFSVFCYKRFNGTVWMQK
jgi:SAM-dependent methyltransferase